MNILKAIFGTKAQRDVKRLRPMVDRINALEIEYQKPARALTLTPSSGTRRSGSFQISQ